MTLVHGGSMEEALIMGGVGALVGAVTGVAVYGIANGGWQRSRVYQEDMNLLNQRGIQSVGYGV